MPRARHVASKLRESDRLLGSGCGLTGCVTDGNSASSGPGSALPKAERAEFCSGHCNNDFGKLFSPSYQHFRPSISRYDQCFWGFDGSAALHCFASAACISIGSTIPNGKIRATKATRLIAWICLLMTHTHALTKLPNFPFKSLG